MELTSPKFIKNLLEKYGARPFKGWGQNFLIDKFVLRKIIDSAELKKSDIVLEIGPGIGTLTQELAKKAGKVISVEKDKKMVRILDETLGDFKNIKVIEEDVLKIKTAALNLKNYKLIGNLPFYITSPLIRKFLEKIEVKPREMILMVQKEVAQRICAKPPDMNLLAVSVQFYAESKILFYVSKNSFWPRPKVDGAVLKIIPLTNTNRKLIDTKLFFRIAKAGFSQPRKQLVNNLSKMLALSLPNGVKLDKEKVKNWLLENGIQPSQRAETLSVKDWIKLTKI
jgi:16S rRNA (adenine1518-N6/adenine1519-N6)-dimethyltransferase